MQFLRLLLHPILAAAVNSCFSGYLSSVDVTRPKMNLPATDTRRISREIVSKYHTRSIIAPTALTVDLQGECFSTTSPSFPTSGDNSRRQMHQSVVTHHEDDDKRASGCHKEKFQKTRQALHSSVAVSIRLDAVTDSPSSRAMGSLRILRLQCGTGLNRSKLKLTVHSRHQKAFAALVLPDSVILPCGLCARSTHR